MVANITESHPDQPDQGQPAKVNEAASEDQRIIDHFDGLEMKLDRAFYDLESRFDELRRLEADLEQRQQQVLFEESKTRLQRRRIAETFRAQRAELGAHPLSEPAEDEALATELERLREKVAMLEDELDATNETAPAPQEAPATPSSNFDWETQKQMLLQSLGSDQPQLEDQIAAVDRAREVVSSTTNVDNREVVQLREQLEGLMSVLANACSSEEVDFNQILEEERAKLEGLQREWHDKLRESELEISVERAKLAREKVKLEEDLRMLKQMSKSQPEEKASNVPRSRWLARLGLADD